MDKLDFNSSSISNISIFSLSSFLVFDTFKEFPSLIRIIFISKNSINCLNDISVSLISISSSIVSIMFFTIIISTIWKYSISSMFNLYLSIYLNKNDTNIILMSFSSPSIYIPLPFLVEIFKL